MNEQLLNEEIKPGPDTAPETTSFGEVQMVREDCWRQVHRLFHVERQSKSEISRRLDLDRKTGPHDSPGIGVASSGSANPRDGPQRTRGLAIGGRRAWRNG